jgi:hypothetical protein
MSYVLVVLTRDEEDKDVRMALGVARAQAAPREAEVQLVRIPSPLPMEEPDPAKLQDPNAREMSEVWNTSARYHLVPTRNTRSCVEEWLERLSPLALVLVRDELHGKGLWDSTVEHVAHRYGIPVAVLRSKDRGEDGSATRR